MFFSDGINKVGFEGVTTEMLSAGVGAISDAIVSVLE